MTNKLITAIIFFLATSAAHAQSKIRPPDLLAPAGDEQEQPVETDREPVPIIKKKKGNPDAPQNNSRYIEHPNAAKGLIKIDKNKIYYYRVKSSDQTKAGSFKIGMYEPTELSGNNYTYDDIYDTSTSPLFIYDHEWQMFQGFGKIGLTLGGGFSLSSGNGQFANGQSDRPKEKFTLFLFPVSLGVIFRGEFYDTQPIAPYAGAGIGGMFFAERRDDDQNPALGARYGASPLGDFYGGVAIQLGRGARSFLDLDREYGINKVWLTGEYRRYIGMGKYDFSGDAINGGLSAEF